MKKVSSYYNKKIACELAKRLREGIYKYKTHVKPTIINGRKAYTVYVGWKK